MDKMSKNPDLEHADTLPFPPVRSTLGMACAALLLVGSPALFPGAAAAQSSTSVSTQIFVNASDVQHNNDNTRGEGIAVGLDRFFINVDHLFNPTWSAHLTTDVQWQRHSDISDLFVRHAYLQQNLGGSHYLRYGSAPTPWIGYVAQRYGFRYINPDATARNKLGAPADWGVHAGGNAGRLNYAVSAVTGAGFQKPRTGKRADLEARASLALTDHLDIAVGAYQGTRAMDKHEPRQHTAKRWNTALSYVDDSWRLGAELFQVENWTRVTEEATDKGRGWSTWASYQLTPSVALLSRHDRTEMSRQLNPSLEERYTKLGVEWLKTQHLRLALVGKRTETTTAVRRDKTDEVGLWAQIVY